VDYFVFGSTLNCEHALLLLLLLLFIRAQGTLVS